MFLMEKYWKKKPQFTRTDNLSFVSIFFLFVFIGFMEIWLNRKKQPKIYPEKRIKNKKLLKNRKDIQRLFDCCLNKIIK